MRATNTHKKPSTTAPVPQPLDRTDRAILKALQRDASISNVALAEKVKLSAPACLRRVERLKQVGLIKNIVALLDNEALDAGMVVLIGVVLDRSTPESFAAFEATWGARAPLGWDVPGAEPVARACVALLSDWFPATTGEMVHVDGGVHAMGA